MAMTKKKWKQCDSDSDSDSVIDTILPTKQPDLIHGHNPRQTRLRCIHKLFWSGKKNTEFLLIIQQEQFNLYSTTDILSWEWQKSYWKKTSAIQSSILFIYLDAYIVFTNIY